MFKSAKSFINNVEKALADRGWSQRDLAERSGIAAPTISKYLSGKMEPSLSAVDAMAEALKVTPAMLLSEEGVPPVLKELDSATESIRELREKMHELFANAFSEKAKRIRIEELAQGFKQASLPANQETQLKKKTITIGEAFEVVRKVLAEARDEDEREEILQKLRFGGSKK